MYIVHTYDMRTAEWLELSLEGLIACDFDIHPTAERLA